MGELEDLKETVQNLIDLNVSLEQTERDQQETIDNLKAQIEILKSVLQERIERYIHM